MARVKREKAPAYQWYPKDALSSASIAAMSLAAEGLYRRLLDHAWLENGLSASADEVFHISKCTTRADFDALWVVVEKRFPIAADGRRRNPRQEVERRKQAKYRRSRKLGAKARWEKEKGRKFSTDARAVHVDCSAFALALAPSEIQVDQIHRRAARAGLSADTPDRARQIRILAALCHSNLLQPFAAAGRSLPNRDGLVAALAQEARTQNIPVSPETAAAAADRALARWARQRLA